MSSSGWRSLLPPARAREAEATALEIAAAIEEGAGPERDASLTNGAAGFALLHGYLAAHTGSTNSEELALLWLDRAVEGIGGLGGDASLFTGASGVGWVGQHLARLLDSEDIDPEGALDEALGRRLEVAAEPGGFDLVGGLAGIAVYALERLPRDEARRNLELIVARLDELAELTPAGVAWFTPPEALPSHRLELTPEGYYDLGVAHGTPAVVALLGRIAAAGVAEHRAQSLLEGAVEWLLSNRLQDGAGSAFAFWLAPRHESDPARTAWCYGDPGVAAALLTAARATGHDEWEGEALSIAREAATQRGEGTGVEDAWLCHGAAGLAHLFNRMHHASGDPVLAEAARHWVERTLAMRESEGGLAGFRQPPGMEEEQGDGTGWLTGAGGVALALLAAAGEVEPGWDRLLAISDGSPAA